ncbi:hypothetical protein PVIIG_00978 [Plasmodium vivax India VII]|uniref:Uncharacterized protein n=3 Tax=Plasmodium vivax TaxID=5855 RepID=A0A0J9TBJ1_PLAVI|nr:hypothetical protein PVIIG_00978 [Plasmodium vivax India VII]KMZ92454.1 hypothetical protein PVMG_03809 [Plasmodium vivax Mauritania I]SCO68048.1 conserved Plasmodium protein, unknown function [Plasmodium vivax]
MTTNRVKLKRFYSEQNEGNVDALNPPEGKEKNVEGKKELPQKDENNSRKKKLLVLSKGLNMKNVSKLDEHSQSGEVAVRPRSRLKKKVITDSSYEEEQKIGQSFDHRDAIDVSDASDTQEENVASYPCAAYAKTKWPSTGGQHKFNEHPSGIRTRGKYERSKVIDTTDESKQSHELSNSDDGGRGARGGKMSKRGTGTSGSRRGGNKLDESDLKRKGGEGSSIGADEEDDIDEEDEINEDERDHRDRSAKNKRGRSTRLAEKSRKGARPNGGRSKSRRVLRKDDNSEEDQREESFGASDEGDDAVEDESSYDDVQKKRDRRNEALSKLKRRKKSAAAKGGENSYEENSYDDYEHSSFYVDDDVNSAGETNISYESGNENFNQCDEYALHLKIFNEQNLGNDMIQFNSISVKKSIRLYIEFTALSLLSPSLKYDANYFKASENVKSVEQSLKVKYSNIHKEFEKKNSLEECYNYYDEGGAERGRRKEKKSKRKKKKNLKRLCEQVSDSGSEGGAEERGGDERGDARNSLDSSGKVKRERKKKKKKYVLSDSSSRSPDGKGRSDASGEDAVEEECEEECEEEYDDECEEECDEECEDECEDEYDEGYDDECEDECEDYYDDYDFDYGRKAKKKVAEQMNDSLIYKLLNSDMLKIYEFVKKEENFSNYDFLKMICKISKNKPRNYYDRCVQKIEKKILSKRDQFESHPFETNFKNILKNYANIFTYYLEYNKIHCCCCNRKLSYACPVFFIKPFYNSSDLWENSFFNFMKVNHFEWLGNEHFLTFKNPLDKLNMRNEDEFKMKNIKQSNRLFIKNQNEKEKKKVLIHININHVDNHPVANNDECIINHLKQSDEVSAFKYTGHSDDKRLKKKRKGFKFNFEYQFKATECKENNLNILMKDICENFYDLSENYIEKDILVLQLGSYCVSAVYYWHVFHHYKFFFTKFIYMRLLDLYKKSKDLFREPLLLAYVLSKRLNKDLYRDFMILMNIDISQIQHKLNECDLFVR